MTRRDTAEKEETQMNTLPINIQDGGIRLSCVLETPGTGACPLVIVLHGFSSNKEKGHTIRACHAMHEAGCATLRMDLDGHGESGGTFQDHTLHKWISNTMAAIDWAVERQAFSCIYLSGHSQGGLVAALVAGMERERVRGLILRAPAFMIPRCAREGSMLGYTFDIHHIPDSIDVIKGLTLGGNYIRVAQMVDEDEAIRRYAGPVLLLHGDEDDVVPCEESVRAAGMYARAELQLLKGETHHFDQCTESMERLITGWLRRQEDRT